MAILTVNQIIDNIDSFINNVKKLSKSYYMFVARPNPWNDDSNPPAADASVEQTELSLYRDLVYGKLISNNDVSYMIKKIEWANNTVYAQYSQNDADLFDGDFYVLTDLGEVYKCIYNNSNSASVIKPSLNTPTGQFQTADGYIWKYMYTVDAGANTKFTTASYIPVNANSEVESNAVPGTIDYITLNNPGIGYRVYEEGFLAGVANNGYDVVLSNSSSQTDDYYVGSSIYLRAGGGAGQIRDVANYVGDQRRLTVDEAFDVYINLNLTDVQGTITVGDLVTQNSTDISHLYDAGYIYAGDVVTQTDTGATGRIDIANASHFSITKDLPSNDFVLNYPIYTTLSAVSLKTGTVSITTGSSVVTAVPAVKDGTVDISSGSTTVLANTGTDFVANYTVGDFIRVGEDPMVNTSTWSVKTGRVSINAGSNVAVAAGVLKSGTVDIASSSNTITTNAGTDFVTDYTVGDFIRVGEDPMVSNTTWTLRSGYVSISAGSNTVISVTGTSLEADYDVGDFIKVGNNQTNSQIRLITFVNSSTITVSSAFSQTYVSNAHYVVPVDQISVITAVNSTVISVNSTFSQTYSNSVHYLLPRFAADYAVGRMIQVGNTSTNAQIRVISSINSTAVVVTNAFSQTYVSNTHYAVPFDQVRRIATVNATTITVTSEFSQTYNGSVHYLLPRFITDYANNSYIKVGNTSSNVQIRRVVSTNATAVLVDPNTPFSQTYVSNAHYAMSIATTPASVTNVERKGTITFTNLDGVNLNVSNVTPVGEQFLIGEKVVQVDEFNVDQGANGIISFTNNSVLQLTSVSGNFQANLYVLGQSSNVKALISTAPLSFPNITLHQPEGTFGVGRPIQVSNFSSNTITGNATVISVSVIPNQLTEYVISPKVKIEGDGNGALAYAYVKVGNTNQSNQITEIRLINQGRDYTIANVVISSNPQYGSNATATASISPIQGHGSNTYMELGAKYAGISLTFSNGDNESYKFPVHGEFRRIGILEDPTFNDATITLDSFDRVKLQLGTRNANTFIPGEIVVQSNTNAAGIVVYSNSSYLELKNVINTDDGMPFFTAETNNANTVVVGLLSNAHANVISTNSRISRFQVLSDVESISEITSGATATIEQVVSNTSIRISNIRGHFNANDIVYDAVTNAYANVVSITTSNGRVDSTENFGHAFTQTCRIPLTSNTGQFMQFEKVVQEASNGTGTVMSANTDIDIELSAEPTPSPFSIGDVLTETTTGATAVVMFANNTYIKCTSVNGSFVPSHTVENQLSSSATITDVYPALVLYNVYNIFSTGSNPIVGQTSGARGLSETSNTIVYPELVRNSGTVSYLENIVPFERSNGSVEKINIVIKF